ncbi:single-stranded-DNA-specific exonuclease RecJ [Paraliobacillus salinarum]|uniref:single-stranded-DNA-specific exonuclease RecJ n=1 Tax=Paraliobacillus salinarum TaxID=1158996 RepID=UPI0015F663ED|nr:single-stranded-DNA-specific exonuclease RecJ [Paraliobacillus salinarum]
MLQSKANWNFKNDDMKALTNNAFHGLGLPPLIEHLLMKRGVETKEDAISFLEPNLDHLYDPSRLTDIDRVRERINQAIDNGESILVFGDYDADGVTATAVLIEALRELGAMCDYYIPNRFTEGYGPNEQAFREAHKQGFQLIITVDTGIAAFGPAQLAKELGIDLIITDHHEVQSELPEAYAIIHPKTSSDYPFKELAGVGVAFKLAHYLLGYFPKQFLDLVVIGTIADLVPLVNENRILAFHGLKAISQSKRPGIISLKNIAGITNAVSEEDIGFLIGPRINAVGRLQSAYPALELLLSEDVEQAESIAKEINEINQERQKIVGNITEEAIGHVEENIEANKRVIVVAKEGWNEGVLGIVASKLVRLYQRPAIVLTLQPDKQRAKGSARSIPAFDLFANGMEIKDLFQQFGGHSQAAGMTLSIDSIAQVRDEFNQLAEQKLSDDDYKEKLEVEKQIELDNIDIKLVQTLDKLAPFGMGNPKPLFYIKGKPTELRQIGSKQNHLKAIFQGENERVQAIGFGMGELYQQVSPQAEMEVVGFLQINEWNGKKNTQIMMKDIAVSEWQLFDFRGSKLWEKQVANYDPESTAIVTFQAANHSFTLPYKHYQLDQLREDDVHDGLKEYKTIIIADLPSEREDIQWLIQSVSPENVVVSYHVSDNQLSQAFPNRNDFKWFYGMLLKRGEFTVSTDVPLLIKHKGWKKDKIEFIIKVFSELEFVKINDGVLRPIEQPSKRDLTESQLYQKMIEQAEIEKIMYYSTYQELKDWLTSQMEQQGSIKEEMIYGL